MHTILCKAIALLSSGEKVGPASSNSSVSSTVVINYQKRFTTIIIWNILLDNKIISLYNILLGSKQIMTFRAQSCSIHICLLLCSQFTVLVLYRILNSESITWLVIMI